MFEEIKKIESFKVVGMKYRGDNKNQEIKALWGKFWPMHTQIKNISEPMRGYGVCFDMDEASKQFTYIAAIGVDSADNLPEGMVAKEVPGGTYAVFVATLPTIMDVYNYAMKEWLPESDYKYRNGIDFELYDDTFDGANPKSEFYIFMPVDKK